MFRGSSTNGKLVLFGARWFGILGATPNSLFLKGNRTQTTNLPLALKSVQRILQFLPTFGGSIHNELVIFFNSIPGSQDHHSLNGSSQKDPWPIS